MGLLGLFVIAACLFGAGGLLGYSVGWAHGHHEAASEEWDALQQAQRRHKRCTPEPAVLRLVDYRHPVFFYDQDGPTPA